jgi:predicted nucleic acid-binding protein
MPDFLLDVNVLVAHAILEHVHHDRVIEALQKRAEVGSTYSVCPIIELGLIRNVMRIAALRIQEARQLLDNERINLNFKFVPDDLSADQLPNGIQGYRQTTDGYLAILARKHGLKLLTIDKNISGSVDLLGSDDTL